MSGEATSSQLWGVTLPTREEHRAHAAGYERQCLHCRFYHPLDGQRGADFGVCFSSLSPYGGRVKFEHQGCGDYLPEEENAA